MSVFEEEQTHPSFGMIELSRTNSSKGLNLFGSSISHHNTMRIRIYKGVVRRHLSRDWYGTKSIKPIIEIELSNSQFADFITSAGVGGGTPVTIRYRDGHEVEDCQHENKRQLFEKEFSAQMNDMCGDIEEDLKRAREILGKKSLLADDKRELLHMFESTKTFLKSNAPFVKQYFNESMDKTVSEAKGEVEAFWMAKILHVGDEEVRRQMENGGLLPPELPGGE